MNNTGGIKLTSGQHNSVVLDKNGKVWNFGHNQYGQLGNGEKTGMDPNPYPALMIPSWGEGVKIQDISAGHNHTVLLDERGRVWYCGWDNYKLPPMPGAPVIGGKDTAVEIKFDKKITAIACGGWHTMALDEDGTLFAWGSNLSAQLGMKDVNVGMGPGAFVNEPAKVDVLPENVRINSIATGGQHVAILDEDGRIWSYGWSQYGQLGNPDIEIGPNSFEKMAVPVSGLDDVVITKVSTGYYHSMALDDQGRVWAWGSNGFGQLGSEKIPDGTDNPAAFTKTPVLVSGLNDVKIVDVEAAYGHSVVLDDNGTVWAWGYNLYGMVGRSDVPNDDFFACTNRPMPVCEWQDERGKSMDVKIKSIMSTTNHTMAVDTSDRVWAWGFNRYGQLGTGGHEDLNLTPRLVMWPKGADVSPEPPAIARIRAFDAEGNELRVEQVGFNIMVYEKFGVGDAMMRRTTLEFTDEYKQDLFADLKEKDVRIMKDRVPIAFGSHTHIDVACDPEKGTLTLGLLLNDKLNYDSGNPLILRFIRSYSELGRAEEFDVYTFTFYSAES